MLYQSFSLLFYCLSEFQQYYIFHMMCLRKHIHWSYTNHPVFFVHQCQIPCLCCRVTTHINHSFRGDFQYLSHHIFMHSVTWRVGNDYVGLTVGLDKFVISPTKKSQFVIWLRSALILASAIASGTASTPITFPAFFDTNWAIVPVPVYKS